MKTALTHTGRTLLAFYFLYPGIMKFVAWDRGVTLMETHGMDNGACTSCTGRHHSNWRQHLPVNKQTSGSLCSSFSRHGFNY